jgi:hypothetical protein
VEITSDDAAVLKLVVDEGRVIDRERLAIQAARERKSPEWRKFWSKENRCVFLGEDGACGIYEDRPSVCRKHVVTTPASACTTDGAAVAPVQPFPGTPACRGADVTGAVMGARNDSIVSALGNSNNVHALQSQ